MARSTYFGQQALTLKKIFEFGGNSGVAFFFVLSGFIIAHAHKNESGETAKVIPYLKKRFNRIYPTYWIIFLIAYSYSLIYPPSSWQVPEEWGILLPAFLLAPIPDGSIKAFSSPILSVAWTLRFEMLFYIFFGLYFLGEKIFFAACATIFLLATYNLIAGLESNQIIAIASSHFMLLFLMGVCAAQCIKISLKRTIKKYILSTGIITFLVASIVFDIHMGELDRAISDLAFGTASALIIVGSVSMEMSANAEKKERSRILKLIRKIGDASYAIYLLHYPLVALICKAGAKFLPINGTGVATTLAVATISSICVGILFHDWIEAPILRFINQRNQFNKIRT